MKSGEFINKAGKGKYLNEESIENVIRYIIRQRRNEDREDELIGWGGLGVPEWEEAEGVIEAFKEAQKLHIRKGRFGRYIDHEIYVFRDETVKIIKELDIDLNRIARQMANDFYQDGTQVVYGVHEKEKEEDGLNLHIHFAVNTVNYKNGNKRRENKTDTKDRSERMERIVKDNVGKAMGTMQL